MIPKPKRIKSPKNLELCRKLPCIVCIELQSPQRSQTQPDHITSRGAGGGDEQTNLMPLCFEHHRQRHDLGIKSFIKKYDSVKLLLEVYGRTDLIDQECSQSERSKGK